MGRALLSVATQDVIQLQQLPLSVSQFDDTGRIGNDDECFLRSFLKLWGFFSQFTPNHHWVSALELFRYSAEEEAIYKRAPCVCSLWSAVCVNTEASAHTGVWTVREVDFFDRFGLSACFLSARTNPECMQGKDGCTDQVQFFRKEHPGFAWAGCGCSKAVFPDLLFLLFQLTLQLMDRLRAEPLHV